MVAAAVVVVHTHTLTWRTTLELDVLTVCMRMDISAPGRKNNIAMQSSIRPKNSFQERIKCYSSKL